MNDSRGTTRTALAAEVYAVEPLGPAAAGADEAAAGDAGAGDVISTWTSKQAEDLVGVTYRQIDHWCRRGIATCVQAAQGSGSRRQFDYTDLIRLRLIKAMRDAGIQLKAIGEVFEFASEMTGAANPETVICFDGDDVTVRDGLQHWSALSEPGQGVWQMVSVGRVRQRLDDDLRKAHPKARIAFPDAQLLLPFGAGAEAVAVGQPDGQLSLFVAGTKSSDAEFMQ